MDDKRIEQLKSDLRATTGGEDLNFINFTVSQVKRFFTCNLEAGKENLYYGLYMKRPDSGWVSVSPGYLDQEEFIAFLKGLQKGIAVGLAAAKEDVKRLEQSLNDRSFGLGVV